MQTLVYILMACFFLALFGFFYFLVSYMVSHKVISTSVGNFVRRTESEAEKRAAMMKEQEELNGELDPSSFNVLTRLDNLIRQSNITKKIPFLNAEIYIIGVVVIFALAVIISSLAFGHVMYGIYFGAAVFLVSFCALLIMRNINYNRIENDIIDFVNLMENYSRTSSDIIDIFGKIYPFLNEPLRSMTQRCYLEGVKTGNIPAALSNFERDVSHKKFREIIHNMAVCSRFDTNYEDIVEDCRQMLQEYLAGKQQKKEMLRAARIEYIIIAALAVVLFFSIGSFMDIDLMGMMFSSTVGNIFLIYFIVVLAISIIGLFITENAKD